MFESSPKSDLSPLQQGTGVFERAFFFFLIMMYKACKTECDVCIPHVTRATS